MSTTTPKGATTTRAMVEQPIHEASEAETFVDMDAYDPMLLASGGDNLQQQDFLTPPSSPTLPPAAPSPFSGQNPGQSNLFSCGFIRSVEDSNIGSVMQRPTMTTSQLFYHIPPGLQVSSANNLMNNPQISKIQRFIR